MKPNRLTISSLAASAVFLVGVTAYEGYTDKAVIPVKGDRPTVGYGSTFREDGSPVQMGDTITPQKAIARTLAHIQKDETALKSCVKSPLSQKEYDLLLDFSYQYGSKVSCKSSIVKSINLEKYEDACKGYLEYRFVSGYDCSTPGNKRCYGVWIRQLDRYTTCMKAQ